MDGHEYHVQHVKDTPIGGWLTPTGVPLPSREVIPILQPSYVQFSQFRSISLGKI